MVSKSSSPFSRCCLSITFTALCVCCPQHTLVGVLRINLLARNFLKHAPCTIRNLLTRIAIHRVATLFRNEIERYHIISLCSCISCVHSPPSTRTSAPVLIPCQIVGVYVACM
jgi:hypothetical protein